MDPGTLYFADVVVPQLYESTGQEVEAKISAADGVAIATDGWTARATQSIITAKVHLASDDWKIECVALQASPLHEVQIKKHIRTSVTGSKGRMAVKQLS